MLSKLSSSRCLSEVKCLPCLVEQFDHPETDYSRIAEFSLVINNDVVLIDAT